MNRPITDAGVAGLAIHEGRAELLEEIMTLAPVETTEPTPVRRHRRVLPLVAAAAAVVAVAGGATWLGRAGGPGSAVSATPAADAPELAVLDAAGWRLEHARVDDAGGELDYVAADGAEVEIDWRPADQYAGYLADREDLGPGDRVEVLGAPARLWSYAADDHTALREVVGAHLLEVRGSHLSRAAYDDVLADLGPLRTEDLAARLPSAAFTADGYTRPGAEARGLPAAPERPALIRAPGWSLGVDDSVFWERGDARVLMTTVGNVPDAFAYDRYLGADVRRPIRVLGQRALLAEWREGDVQYRVAALSATPSTLLIFEGTGLTRAAFLDAVASAQWVSKEDYEAAVAGQG